MAQTNDGVYHSRVLAKFWLNPQWLWQPENYSALAASAEIAGLPQEMVKMLQGSEQ